MDEDEKHLHWRYGWLPEQGHNKSNLRRVPLNFVYFVIARRRQSDHAAGKEGRENSFL
jgi:hypothetical protein